MPALRPPTQTLLDRIAALRAEIDELIDQLVERDAGCGIPAGVLRQTYTHGSVCHCAVYNVLNAEGKLK